MLRTDTNYFPALTGVRAVAAYLVFFHHYNPFERYGSDWSLRNFVNEWHIGVTMFFVLSGFLISFRYYDNFKSSFRRYIINRFARIYPVYFLLTTITFILARADYGSDFLLVYFANISLMRGLFYDLTFTGIMQGWSLTVEEIFYFSAPFIFACIRINKNWIFILPAITLSFGIAFVVLAGSSLPYGFFDNYRFMFLYTYFGRCIEFFIGIYIGINIKSWSIQFKSPILTTTGLVFIFISILTLSLIKGDLKYGILHPVGIFINNVFLPLAGVALFYVGLIIEKSQLKNLLSSKPMILLGKSSYVFYLIHMGFIADFLTESFNMNSLVKFVVLNILSILIFKFIEDPLNNMIKKIGRKPDISPS